MRWCSVRRGGSYRARDRAYDRSATRGTARGSRRRTQGDVSTKVVSEDHPRHRIAQIVDGIVKCHLAAHSHRIWRNRGIRSRAARAGAGECQANLGP